MIKIHRLISTSLGIGYLGKGSGTIAAVFCLVVWYLLGVNGCGNGIFIGATLVICLLGVWSASKVEAAWGKDSNKVVIDEVAGMCISLLLLPVQLKYFIPSLILFRFFDIVKPLYIKKLEVLPGGWGVMADDLLAGIYANAIMQAIVMFKIF